MVKIRVCKRCGHEWALRKSQDGEPVTCPKCKTPYWNKERVKGGEKNDR